MAGVRMRMRQAARGQAIVINRKAAVLRAAYNTNDTLVQ